MGSTNFTSECPVCLGAHDEQIHDATIRVHAWWRDVLLYRICEPEPEYGPVTAEF